MVSAVVAGNLANLILGSSQNFGEIDAGFVSGLIQHPDGIFGGKVTGSTGGEGTASQTRQSSLNVSHTALNGRHGIDHAQAASIMQMNLNMHIRICFLTGPNYFLHLLRIGNTDGIAVIDCFHTSLLIRPQELHDGIRILILAAFALKGATKGCGKIQYTLHVGIGLHHLAVRI